MSPQPSDSQDASSIPPSNPSESVRTTTILKTATDRRRRLNQYDVGVRVGKGKHGDVFLCRDRDTNGEVAVKVVKRSNPRDKIKLLRKTYQQNGPPLSSTEHSIRKEIAIMKKCREGNWHHVQLLEVIDDPQQDKIYLVMEYLPGGPVQWTNEHHEPILTLDQSRRIMRDVILGLEYLHHRGIIHRDIKPANLLWTQDRSNVKIIDFGVSHYTPSRERSSKRVKAGKLIDDSALFPESELLRRIGTPSFLAPEVVWFSDHDTPASASYDTLASTQQNTSDTVHVVTNAMPSQRPAITQAIDVWSLAVTFYCFLFGHTPFNSPSSANDNMHHNEYMLYKQICTQDWTVDETMGAEQITSGGRHPKDFESEGCIIVDLLDKMLQKDPQIRMTLAELKRHPWFLHGIFNPKQWLRETSPVTRSGPTAWAKQFSHKFLTLLKPTITSCP